MTIAPVNNLDYYTELSESKDYYLEGSEPKGIWLGAMSRHFRLNGKEVNSAQYKTLMSGRGLDGVDLVQNAGINGRRCAWDLTFSAPKSLSLLASACDESIKKEIYLAQQLAVERAIEFIEKHAAFTRRGSNGVLSEPVVGLLAATFCHSSNRELEPQLHTHALVVNLAQRLDDTWGSIDSNHFYKWQKTAGAIYRAQLAFQMEKIGFGCKKDRAFFQVEGVSQELCMKYSSRARQIQAQLEAHGVASSASPLGDKLKLSTRKSKKSIPLEVLQENWKTELFHAGLDPYVLQRKDLTKQSRERPQPSFDKIYEIITDNKAIFGIQDIYQAVALEAIESGMDANAIESICCKILRDSNLVEISSTPGNILSKKFTTKDVIDEENALVALAKDLSRKNTVCVDHEIQVRALNKVEEDIRAVQVSIHESFAFDAVQKNAITHIFNSGDLAIVQGSAGAGKSTLLRVAKEGFESTGLKVIGACVAKRAADHLTEETGIPAQTVASIAEGISKGRDPLRGVDVLVVDEAGQLSSKALLSLIVECRNSGCKLILTGEDKQLDSIDRPGALRYLSREDVVGAFRVEKIKRQRDPLSRKVVELLRDGHSRQALEIMDSQRCISYNENKDAAKTTLVFDWVAFSKANPEKQSLVIAHKWSDVIELSEKIRAIHIEAGLVNDENISTLCSVAGRSIVSEISSGDRIKFTKNDYRSLMVTNGTLGTVTSIRQTESDVEFAVRTDEGRQISFLASEYRDELGVNICLAYALTVYSSQGVTVDGDTFVLYSPGMDRANSYVALSRHRDRSRLYVNSAELDEYAGKLDSGLDIDSDQRASVLAELMGRDVRGELAIEHLEKIKFEPERMVGMQLEVMD